MAMFMAPMTMPPLGADEDPNRCNERRDEVGVVYLRGVIDVRGVRGVRGVRCSWVVPAPLRLGPGTREQL
jgi:hypothetical protein